ncbi:hypothetical protein Y032_0105g3662 [Ancylostoma ceylanicum]|uniref:Uncharacterized protein n=1 Tax=Ancylostoma ceylanicum TaxID=53326 RepID=A0A016TG48_9BILA|nr:hypothetical protein Y032_0105g3662 [Ancylostoma ceylanicum]
MESRKFLRNCNYMIYAWKRFAGHMATSVLYNFVDAEKALEKCRGIMARPPVEAADPPQLMVDAQTFWILFGVLNRE